MSHFCRVEFSLPHRHSFGSSHNLGRKDCVTSHKRTPAREAMLLLGVAEHILQFKV